MVVQQVPKGAGQANGCRFVVVGAEEADQIRVGRERCVNAVDGIGSEFHIGIDEEQDLAPGRLRGKVAGNRRTGTGAGLHDPDIGAGEPRGGRRG